MPSSLIGPAIGAVVGGISGGGKKGGTQAAPTTFQSLPPELQQFGTEQILPRLQELFSRQPDVSPKRRAISPTADPLFASQELFDLQRFADLNQGATTTQPVAPTAAPTDTGAGGPTSLADEFLSGLNVQVPGSARGFNFGGGNFSGDLGAQLASFGDLGTLSQDLAGQGFTSGTQVTPDSLRGIDLTSLLAAARGIL